MQIETKHLRAIAPHANDKILSALPAALNHWLPIYGLTDRRIAQMFLGEAAEETDGFKTFQEYASGAAYEGRKDLGNIHPGDGVKYKGRGMFDTTGLANYTKEAKELGIDIVNHPELLLIADNAVHAACAYWVDHHLSPYAVIGDITTVTKRINGGLNGLGARIAYWNRCKLVITADIDIPPHVAALGAIQQPQVPVKVALAAQTVKPSLAPLKTSSAPVGNRLTSIGDTTMSVLPTKSTLNIASLIGIATSFGAVLPQIYAVFGTNGLIGAAAFAFCFLIQAFLPVGTATAVESVAVSAIPVVEGLDPALKPVLEKLLAGIKAEQAIPAAATVA